MLEVKGNRLKFMYKLNIQSLHPHSSELAGQMDNTKEYQAILAPDRNQGGNKVDEHPEKRPLRHNSFYCFYILLCISSKKKHIPSA